MFSVPPETPGNGFMEVRSCGLSASNFRCHQGQLIVRGESTVRTANRGQAVVPVLVFRLHQKYMDVALILYDIREDGRLPLRRAPTRTFWRSSSCDNVGSKFGM